VKVILKERVRLRQNKVEKNTRRKLAACKGESATRKVAIFGGNQRKSGDFAT